MSVHSRRSSGSWKSSHNGRNSPTRSRGRSPTPHMQQFTVQANMASHYQRLQQVKSVVDTSLPKSYIVRHSAPSSRSTSPGSRSTSRASSSGSHSMQGTVDSKYVEKVRSTADRINFHLEALRWEQRRLLAQVALPSTHWRRPGSCGSARLSDTNSLASARSKSRDQHDLLIAHSDAFTTPNKPYTPRVIRCDAKPTLLEYRFYNPPRRKNGQSGETLLQTPQSETHQKNAANLSLLERNVIKDVKQCHYNDASHPDQFLDRNEQQPVVRHFRHNGCSPSPIKATQPFRSVVSIVEQPDRHKSGSTDEEDLKYLEFIVEVTNDVLTRGIFSDKTLVQIFNQHIERKKKELDVKKMEKALSKLRLDLGIQAEGSPSITSGITNESSRSKWVVQQPNGHVQSSSTIKTIGNEKNPIETVSFGSPKPTSPRTLLYLSDMNLERNKSSTHGTNNHNENSSSSFVTRVSNDSNPEHLESDYQTPVSDKNRKVDSTLEALFLVRGQPTSSLNGQEVDSSSVSCDTFTIQKESEGCEYDEDFEADEDLGANGESRLSETVLNGHDPFDDF